MGKFASSQDGLERKLPVLGSLLLPHTWPWQASSRLVRTGGGMPALCSISLALSSMCFPISTFPRQCSIPYKLTSNRKLPMLFKVKR